MAKSKFLGRIEILKETIFTSFANSKPIYASCSVTSYQDNGLSFDKAKSFGRKLVRPFHQPSKCPSLNSPFCLTYTPWIWRFVLPMSAWSKTCREPSFSFCLPCCLNFLQILSVPLLFVESGCQLLQPCCPLVVNCSYPFL